MGVAMALSGAIRDLVNAVGTAARGLWGLATAANGYLTVYALEVALLLVAIVAIMPLVARKTPAPRALALGVGPSGLGPRGGPAA